MELTEITENEKRRAENLIWNAAEDHHLRSELKVYDSDGRAERYWNSIIGAAHRRYDWAPIGALLASFQDLPDQGSYETLTWLALENAVYQTERKRRPALTYLRREYARRSLDRHADIVSEDACDALMEGHLRRALGQDDGLSPRDQALLDGLELGPELTAAECAERIDALLRQYLHFRPEDAGRKKSPRQWLLAALRPSRSKKGQETVRGFAFGFGVHAAAPEDDADPALGGNGRAGMGHHIDQLTRQSREKLQEYIENYFGAPLYDRAQVRRFEAEFCTGAHKYCRLHFTRGGYENAALAAGYVGAQKRNNLKQVARNRAYYNDHLAQARHSIDRLASRLQNTLLTQLETAPAKSAAGNLVGGRVWRGLYLDDGNIFTRELRSGAGELSVDLLLDASNSQEERQSIVANQGYIIASALTRCGLPVRVWSFCSMSGYTVVNLFRDYHETGKNENIFNYFANGCNRDGLAVRIAAGMLRQSSCEHKLLILLSDAKPNDVMKMPASGDAAQEYAGDAGVADTAAEVHRARLDGVQVVCVFTGADEDLPAARTIYGRDFTRIRSLNQFADAVGALIQEQIKNL